MDDLIDWLTARQKAEGLSDEEMAAKLTATGRIKLSRSMWNHIKRRKLKRGPSIDLLRAACTAWFEHHDEIQRAATPDCAA